MVEKAKKRALGVGNLDFSVHSADDLSSFQPKSYDVVTMSYVLMRPDAVSPRRNEGSWPTSPTWKGDVDGFHG